MRSLSFSLRYLLTLAAFRALCLSFFAFLRSKLLCFALENLSKLIPIPKRDCLELHFPPLMFFPILFCDKQGSRPCRSRLVWDVSSFLGTFGGLVGLWFAYVIPVRQSKLHTRELIEGPSVSFEGFDLM